MTTAQETINNTARETGWCLQPVENQWDTHEYRRRYGRRIEVIWVTYSARGSVTSASWAPTLAGYNTRIAIGVGKKDWILAKMHNPQPC